MEAIEPYDEMRNKARVGAGWKGGPFMKNPVVVPARTIVDGYPAEVAEKLGATSITQGTPTDPWVARYPGAKK
jgi:hypothetical protein